MNAGHDHKPHPRPAAGHATVAERLGHEFDGADGTAALARSGGSEPGTSVNPSAVEAMAERGIDTPPSTRSRGPTRSSAPRTP